MRGLLRRFWILLLFGTGAAAAQIKPVKIADVTANVSPDPSVAMSLKDIKHVVVTVAPDKVFYSTDGGIVWNEVILKSKFGVQGGARIVAGPKGSFDLVHSCDPVAPHTNPGFAMQSSEDDGMTWKEGIFFGNNASKDPKDIKDVTNFSMSWHPRKRTLFAVWTQSDQFGLQDPNCHSNIMFSTWGGGKQWSKSFQLNQTPGDCMGGAQSAGGASVVMDMNEHLFSVWSNQGMIFFDRSYDDGKMWLTRDLAIGQPATMTLNVAGFPVLTSRPVLVVDNTEMRTRGGLYTIYAEGSKGSTDSNIALLRSTNRGDNWVGPTRFRKQDAAGQQFAPSIAIDQTSGHVFIVYYDRRSYEDTKTDLYLAYSTDGGNNFTETKLNEEPFAPGVSNTISPSTSVSAHAGVVAVAWTRIDDTHASVWGVTIDENDLRPKKQEAELKK